MSSIAGLNRYDQNRHMNYIATAAYGDNIFTYTTSQNATTFVYSGTLQSLLNAGTVTGSTAPVGRILRTNGRKLFPGANPCSSIITTAGGTVAVTEIRSQMVGVIDVVTGISGFIDPNDSLFAIYNVDKAIDFPNDGANPLNVAHRGPSVYTAGNVTAGLQIGSTGVTALTTIAGTGAQGTQAINPTLGQLVTFTVSSTGAASITLTASSAALGSLVRLLITATTVQNTTITFGTGFRSVGTLVVTAAAGPANQSYIVTFVGNGTSMFEVSRTAAMA